MCSYQRRCFLEKLEQDMAAADNAKVRGPIWTVENGIPTYWGPQGKWAHEC